MTGGTYTCLRELGSNFMRSKLTPYKVPLAYERRLVIDTVRLCIVAFKHFVISANLRRRTRERNSRTRVLIRAFFPAEQWLVNS